MQLEKLAEINMLTNEPKELSLAKGKNLLGLYIRTYPKVKASTSFNLSDLGVVTVILNEDIIVKDIDIEKLIKRTDLEFGLAKKETADGSQSSATYKTQNFIIRFFDVALPSALPIRATDEFYIHFYNISSSKVDECKAYVYAILSDADYQYHLRHEKQTISLGGRKEKQLPVSDVTNLMLTLHSGATQPDRVEIFLDGERRYNGEWSDILYITDLENKIEASASNIANIDTATTNLFESASDNVVVIVHGGSGNMDLYYTYIDVYEDRVSEEE